MYGLLLKMKLVYMIPISAVPILRLTIDLGPHRGRMVTTFFVNNRLTDILPAKNINCYNNSLCSYIYIFTTAHFAKGMQWVMGFLKILLSQKDYNIKENREQFLVPFLLQAFLSLSYLLHNSMSKELFREASKHRNNKQEEKRKSNMKENGRESSMSSFALSIF